MCLAGSLGDVQHERQTGALLAGVLALLVTGFAVGGMRGVCRLAARSMHGWPLEAILLAERRVGRLR